MRKVRKPKAPKLTASKQRWDKYKKDLSEWKKYQRELDARRKLKDS